MLCNVQLVACVALPLAQGNLPGRLAHCMQLCNRTQYVAGVWHLTSHADHACTAHAQRLKECVCVNPGVFLVADYQRTHSTHHALLGIEVSHH